MRFGFCTSLDNIELVEKIGFDFIEAPLNSIHALGDAEFDALAEKVNRMKIRVDCVNLLYPKTLSLIGPGADPAGIDAYLDKAFSRANKLGTKIAVFGSGKSRAIPESYPMHRGFAELIDVTRRTGEAAKKYGITIAIEPLNRDESNCINSLAEGAMLQAAVGSDSVGLLADLYHMRKEDEPMKYIKAIGELTHTHIAVLAGRACPCEMCDEIADFFTALASINYQGAMSIEGKAQNLETDAEKALKLLRSLQTQ